MFEKLVVSSVQRRRGRTAKFFVCTSLVYLSAIGVAFALSVLLAEPRLADTTGQPEVRTVPLARSGTPPRKVVTPDRSSGSTPRPDPNNVMKYEDITAQQKIGPPRFKIPEGVSVGPDDGVLNGRSDGIPDGLDSLPASIGGGGKANHQTPIPPDPPKPQLRPADKAPLRLTSTVLQGKVIERVVPVYPQLARTIRLHGDVSTEVIISPEGRVESVRVVSGHPMLVQAAIDAARRWRFEPTILNGVPVRVTGVITFVFKLNE